MCGIVSVIQKNWDNTLTYGAEKAFNVMLFADAVRGTDGTGYFYHNNVKKQVMYQKLGKPSWEAMGHMADIKKLAGNASWIVGHNRKATMGKGLDSEAHPFIHKDITLVHNGTLNNHHALAYDLKVKVDVDSEIIPHMLMAYKPKEALEQLSGAYALVWHNDEKNRLYFARNKERPLWWVETEQFITIVSEPGLAKWAYERNEIKVTKVEEIPVGVIYELLWNKAKKLQIIKTKFTPKEAPNKYYNGWSSETTTTTYKPPALITQGEFWGYSDRYKEGPVTRDQVILFEPTKKNHRFTGHSYIGYAIDAPEVVVDCNPAKELSIGKLYYGRVTSTWYVGKVLNAYVTSVVEADDLAWSANEVVLTDRVIGILDKCSCKACGTQELSYDDCFVEMSPDHEPSYYCVECSWSLKQEEMTFYAMESRNHYLAA